MSPYTSSHYDTFFSFGDFVHNSRVGIKPDILWAKCLHLIIEISVLECVSSSSTYPFVQTVNNVDQGELFYNLNYNNILLHLFVCSNIPSFAQWELFKLAHELYFTPCHCVCVCAGLLVCALMFLCLFLCLFLTLQGALCSYLLIPDLGIKIHPKKPVSHPKRMILGSNIWGNASQGCGISLIVLPLHWQTKNSYTRVNKHSDMHTMVTDTACNYLSPSIYTWFQAALSSGNPWPHASFTPPHLVIPVNFHSYHEKSHSTGAHPLTWLFNSRTQCSSLKIIHLFPIGTNLIYYSTVLTWNLLWLSTDRLCSCSQSFSLMAFPQAQHWAVVIFVRQVYGFATVRIPSCAPNLLN